MPTQNRPLNLSTSRRQTSNQSPPSVQPQPLNISTKKSKPEETINLSTGSKLPKKTGEVKEPIRRRAAPKIEDGIPKVYSAGVSQQSVGERREVIPSRQVEETGEPEVKNLVEGVLDDLDHVIDQKIQEYNDFCEALIQEDEINRASLTEEQIAAEVKSPDEDPLDKGNFSEAEVSAEEAFKNQELDPVEIAMGVGEEKKQKDYNSYKKNKSIFDIPSSKPKTKPFPDIAHKDQWPTKEEVPQLVPTKPKINAHMEVPFIVKEKEDGTKVQGANIEDLANTKGLSIDEVAHEMTALEPVKELVDEMIEKIPDLKEMTSEIPNETATEIVKENLLNKNKETISEEESSSENTDFEEVEDNSTNKIENHSSNNHETLDEIMKDFEINEEDKSRMEEIKQTMTLSPEDRAKLVMEKQMKEQEEAMAAQMQVAEVSEVKIPATNERSIVDPAKTLGESEGDIFADIDDEDFKDLDSEGDDVEEKEDPFEDEHMKELQKEITEKIQVVSEKFDLKSFSIAKKPISYQTALRKEETNERVTDWVLMSSNRHIAFTSFSGVQLEKINPSSSGRNAINSIRTQWQEIFEHVVDPYKPETLEQWVKTIRYTDIENIYFGIYVSNFIDSNFIPYTCEHCKSMFLSDNMNILDMLKYKNKEAEEKFKRLYNEEPTPASAKYPTEIVPISDEIAVEIKNPSIYDVLFEPAALDANFRDKYEEVLSLMVYIDAMYRIDRSNSTLIPIAVKEYPSNMAKTVKSKIITYSKILSSLKVDSYSILRAFIRQMVTDKEEELKFQIPEVTCSKCGTVIKKEERTALNILFTRHQLAALATM